jgi:hypothetical protein
MKETTEKDLFHLASATQQATQQRFVSAGGPRERILNKDLFHLAGLESGYSTKICFTWRA